MKDGRGPGPEQCLVIQHFRGRRLTNRLGQALRASQSLRNRKCKQIARRGESNTFQMAHRSSIEPQTCKPRLDAAG